MQPVRSARLVQTTARGLRLDAGEGVEFRISVLGPDLVRVCAVRDGQFRQSRSWMVPAHGEDDVPWEGRDRADETSWPITPFDARSDDATVTLATSALTLTITRAPFALAWSLPGGTVFARDRDAHATMFGAHAIRHAAARDAGDAYFGLGDKTGPLNLHGRRLRTAMMDSLGFDPERGDPLYKHWPFLIVRDGVSGVASGVFYDNMPGATFDLGCEHDNYYGLYRSYEAPDGDLDYYVFPGPGVADVTRKFLALTGRPALPPRWSLGFAQTAMAIADSDNAQERMEAFIDTCAREEIPVSAFHFGSGYTTIGHRRYVFTWNRDKYPDPHGLMRRFHEAGMHVVANLKPCLLDSHPRFDEPRDAYVQQRDGGPAISQFWDGEGAHIDFTNPDGIAWWQRGVREQVLAFGIDVAWNDNNEYSLPNEDAVCAGFGTPAPLDLVRPLQPLLMTRASVEEQQRDEPDVRAFSVTRAGCPGIQRYAQTWSGDNSTSWRSLKWNLRTGLTMSLSGMINTGHDVGGFSGPVPDAELLVRWTQAGLVHPRFIMNSWKPDGVYTTPWLHPEATPLIRDAIRLRYRLMPYLYSIMHQAHADGTPPLLPTFAVFDAAAVADSDALMLGPFVLACPVTAPGARQVEVDLPAGPACWFEFYTEQHLRAGERHTLAAPLDRLPLAVPEGAILPMTDAGDDFSRLHDEPSRQLRIFPGIGEGESRFTLVEDDGISERGLTTRITCHLRWTHDAVTLDAAAEGGYELPYDRIAVVMPRAERRPLETRSGPGVPSLYAR
ncbi:MAG TPA: TIM-barrel domain-containing protein [Acetobacteraceae bacterium]|nr:TIM-barrel domain-containing protein [Acetobacteraceae bacterium]